MIGTFEGAYSWYEACIFRADDYAPETVRTQSEQLDAALYVSDLHRETPDLNALIEPVGWSLVLNGEDGKCAWRVQANRVAEATFGRYHVEWPIGPSVGVVDGPKEQGYGLGEKFVEALRPGDRVGLLMRAQFPGWENLLRYASVKLVYDVR